MLSFVGRSKAIHGPKHQTTFLQLLAIAATLVCVVRSDGTGILGAGKWLYKPVCAHSCRVVLRDSHLLCEAGNAVTKRQHHPASDSSPECWLLDAAFLRTMALCIDEYCARDRIPLSVIEEYWEGHLATGSIGDWSQEMRPIMSYQEALRFANDDVDDLGAENVPIVVLGEPLNETSFVAEDDFIPTKNYQTAFQWGEFDHGVNSLVISITLVALPIVLSLFRFLPGHSRWSSRINAILDQPLWGRRHRVPVFGNMGLMPTRGQSLFIAYILIVNVVLMVLPLRTLLPNSRAETHQQQQIQIVGDRAGVLAFSLYVALFLFSSRNNILLWITNWSHGTFLLLHRWVAYACIYQTSMHSILLLHYYRAYGDATAESQLPYWYWGIIATLTTCLLWPASLLPVRQKMYEIFLATHQILSALTLIGAFLHIWYLYEWNWGYEIWIYAAGAIWFLDRAIRVLRMASNGLRKAVVTTVDIESDLFRIEIDGITAEGHVYLYFPTLSWRFWESHPFSVLASYSTIPTESLSMNPLLVSASPSDVEKRPHPVEEDSIQRATSSSSAEPTTPSLAGPAGPRVSILVRPQKGITSVLLSRARATGGKLSLPVLVESSYHANPSTRNLSHCSTLVCIAGGVGITAILPLARTFGGLRSRIWWGVKHDDIVRAIRPELEQLGASVEIETTVGVRFPVTGILRDELMREDEKGNVGVVVCGPAGMADDVRMAVGELVGSGRAKRAVVFIDEAFSW